MRRKITGYGESGEDYAYRWAMHYAIAKAMEALAQGMRYCPNIAHPDGYELTVAISVAIKALQEVQRNNTYDDEVKGWAQVR